MPSEIYDSGQYYNNLFYNNKPTPQGIPNGIKNLTNSQTIYGNNNINSIPNRIPLNENERLNINPAILNEEDKDQLKLFTEKLIDEEINLNDSNIEEIDKDKLKLIIEKLIDEEIDDEVDLYDSNLHLASSHPDYTKITNKIRNLLPKIKTLLNPKLKMVPTMSKQSIKEQQISSIGNINESEDGRRFLIVPGEYFGPDEDQIEMVLSDKLFRKIYEVFKEKGLINGQEEELKFEQVLTAIKDDEEEKVLIKKNKVDIITPDQTDSNKQQNTLDQQSNLQRIALSKTQKEDIRKHFNYLLKRRTMHFPTCYNDITTKTATCHKPTVLLFALFLGLICIASISGNFIVLLVIAKTARLRRPPAVYKVSLAIADLLLSLFVIPSLLYNLGRNILIPDKPVYTLTDEATGLHDPNLNPNIPSWIPRTVGSAQLISMTASILTLLVMSIDRLVAIRWPLIHRIHNSMNRAIIPIVIIWLLSLIPTILLNISKNIQWHLETHTMTFGPTFYEVGKDVYNLLPLNSKIFGISYCLIYWVLPWIITTALTVGVGFYGWKSLKSLKRFPKQRIQIKHSDTSTTSDGSNDSTIKIAMPFNEISNNNRDSSATRATNSTASGHEGTKVIRTRDSKSEDSSKRLVKTLSILVIMYTLCTLPLTILQLYMWISEGSNVGGDSFRWTWFIACFVYLLQSALNIFIYHRSKEFSEAMKTLCGYKRTSVYNSTSYRTTQRTNLTKMNNSGTTRIFQHNGVDNTRSFDRSYMVPKLSWFSASKTSTPQLKRDCAIHYTQQAKSISRVQSKKQSLPPGADAVIPTEIVKRVSITANDLDVRNTTNQDSGHCSCVETISINSDDSNSGHGAHDMMV